MGSFTPVSQGLLVATTCVKGWMYNGFGHTVVERGVVAIVTMITIDKEYWSWVSI